jgi:hypothetical protein
MPTSYSAWTYLGGSLYSSSSTTVSSPHVQRGAKSFYNTPVTALSAGTALSTTSVTLTGLIPSNALSEDVYFTLLSTDTAVNNTASIYVSSSAQFANLPVSAITGGIVGSNSIPLTMPNVGQNIFYSVTTTNANLTATLLAWTNPNGDV